MQDTSPVPSTTPIPVPEIKSEEPVAVIPIASVAPIDGPPDGERINTFALRSNSSPSGFATLGAGMRDRMAGKPLTYVAAAFALGMVLARALR